VGYRVKSLIATRFRILAGQRLKEYIIKGIVMMESGIWWNWPVPYKPINKLLRRARKHGRSEGILQTMHETVASYTQKEKP
jgi:hypothetical protein